MENRDYGDGTKKTLEGNMLEEKLLKKIKTVIAILLIINFFCLFVGYSFLYFINFILIFIIIILIIKSLILLISRKDTFYFCFIVLNILLLIIYFLLIFMGALMMSGF